MDPVEKANKANLIAKRLLSKELEDDLGECFDCENCGGQETVWMVEDHPFTHEDLEEEIVLPVYVCSVCGEEAFTSESLQILLQKVETSNGRPYVKVIVEDSNIIKYVVH